MTDQDHLTDEASVLQWAMAVKADNVADRSMARYLAMCVGHYRDESHKLADLKSRVEHAENVSRGLSRQRVADMRTIDELQEQVRALRHECEHWRSAKLHNEDATLPSSELPTSKA